MSRSLVKALKQKRKDTKTFRFARHARKTEGPRLNLTSTNRACERMKSAYPIIIFTTREGHPQFFSNSIDY